MGCFPFTHDYGAPVSAHKLVMRDEFDPELIAGVYTRLLFVCSDCGKVKVKKIKGYWPAELLKDARI